LASLEEAKQAPAELQRFASAIATSFTTHRTYDGLAAILELTAANFCTSSIPDISVMAPLRGGASISAEQRDHQKRLHQPSEVRLSNVTP